MKTRRIKTLSLILAAVFVFSLIPAPVHADTGYAANSAYIVTVSDTAAIYAVTAELKRILPEAQVNYTYSSILHGFSVTLGADMLPTLIALDGVLSVSPEVEYQTLEAELDVQSSSAANVSSYIADPHFGEGSVIAIIDNGFNVKHELFTLDDTANVKLTESDIAGIYHFTNAHRQNSFFTWDKTYVNRKIPFAFDYITGTCEVKTASNHGTAMAAVAAGNARGNINLPSGTAPYAQLLLMKVYSEATGTAQTGAVIAALEDAYILGADVVNLSLGKPCGFSESGYYDEALENTINKMSERGITVVCSAGNNSTLGEASAYNLTASYWEPNTEFPDSGTVNTPATSESVIAAAAANVYNGQHPAVRLTYNGSLIAYSDSNNDAVLGSPRKYFNESFNGKTLEYAVVPGLGKEEDYIKDGNSLDLRGRVALIERGEITFAEKVNNAEKHGAVAAIIYDNIEDAVSLRTKMVLDDSNLPAIFISKADGMILKDAAVKKIYVESTLSVYSNAGIAPKSTEFSSWGPTPTLKIKPELTAPGSGIRSAASDGGYASISGTSPSSAFISGLAAGILPKLSGLSGTEKTNTLKNLLMSSAAIMTDGETPYSVNVQGAGLVDYKSAAQADLIITHNGVSKLELGNKLSDSFELSFEVENLSGKAKELKLSVMLGTPDLETLTYETLCGENDYYFEHTKKTLYEILGKSKTDTVSFMKPTLKLFDNASITLDGNTINASKKQSYGITLNGKSKTLIRLNVTLSEAELAEFEKLYPNGMYIEGFIKLDGEQSYSMPFLGFRGDFYSSSPFDSSLYEAASPFGGNYLYTVCQNDRFDSTAELGTNNMYGYNTLSMSFDERLSILSPFGDGCDGSLYASVSLIRNLASLKATVYDETGNELHNTNVLRGLAKAYAEPTLGTTNRYSLKLWDCRSDENDKYVYGDGKYLCKLIGTDPVGNTFEQSFNFYVDSRKPELVSYSIHSENGKKILSLTVRDNMYMQAAYLTTDRGKKLAPLESHTFSKDNLLAAGADAAHTLTYDITDVSALYVYAELYDIAFNCKTVRMSVTEG